MNNWSRLAVFDLETTGVDVDTARIVSACIAILSGEGDVVARWDWLADPGVEIPEGATAVHGISTERARADGRPAAVVVAEIAQTLRVTFGQGIPLVVYNAPYDITLLDTECRRYGIAPLVDPSPVIDPLVLDKAVDKYRKGKRTLTVTTALYGVVLDDAHDAGSDAIAAGRVAQQLARAYPDELDIPMADLHAQQVEWYAAQAASFQTYIRSAKGDAVFVSDPSWPMREVIHPESLIDTKPLPAPAPRPSRTVPIIDIYGPDALLLGMHSLRRTEAADAVGAEPVETEPVETEPVETESLETEPVETKRVETERVETEPVETESLETESLETNADAIDLEGALPEPATILTAQDSPAGVPDVPVSHKALSVLRVAAGIITDSAGRTLLVRKRGITAFMQAGGKIEDGESALVALTRELREELDLELDPGATEYLGSFSAEAANEPDTVIRAEVFALVANGELEPRGEIEEIIWIDSAHGEGLELAPLTRDTILQLWAQRRSTLF